MKRGKDPMKLFSTKPVPGAKEVGERCPHLLALSPHRSPSTRRAPGPIQWRRHETGARRRIQDLLRHYRVCATGQLPATRGSTKRVASDDYCNRARHVVRALLWSADNAPVSVERRARRHRGLVREVARGRRGDCERTRASVTRWQSTHRGCQPDGGRPPDPKPQPRDPTTPVCVLTKEAVERHGDSAWHHRADCPRGDATRLVRAVTRTASLG